MSKQAVMSNPHLNHLVMALEMPIWTLRQKRIDQSQSLNLSLATPDMPGDIPHRNINRPPRRAWDKSLKTTYHLLTPQASNIEKTTIDVKKEVHSGMAASTGGKCEPCQ